MQILDLDAIRAATVHHAPYDFFMGKGAIRADAIPALRDDFPDIKPTGYHPLEQMEVKGAFADLIREMEGPDFTAAVSDTLGVDLRPYPVLITIRKQSAAHEGRIHCDSESKIATLLIYLNEGWLSPDGRFRVLTSDKDFNSYVAEVSPEMGSVVAFKRADHSWHGHTPVRWGAARGADRLGAQPGRHRPQEEAAHHVELLQEPVQGRKGRGDVEVGRPPALPFRDIFLPAVDMETI